MKLILIWVPRVDPILEVSVLKEVASVDIGKIWDPSQSNARPGDTAPEWLLFKSRQDVFVGGLRTGEIPGTGHLERILFNQDMQELRRESLLTDLRQRIRDVRMGPDELLYVLTDEEQGAVLRIEPAD